MEDLFDTFNRLTQLRTRESEPSTHRSKTISAAGRYLPKSSKAQAQKRKFEVAPEILNDMYESYDLDSKSGAQSKWFDLDHAVATGIERRMGSSFKSSETDELDFSPGPLEYSDEEFSEDLSEKNKKSKESVILEKIK